MKYLRQFSAKSNTYRLITTSNWTPLGESWFGVLSKLSYYNKLDNKSHQSVLFRNGLNVNASAYSKNPSISGNYDKEYILNHTSWNLGSLRMVGEEFLTSYGETNVQASKCNVLRFCPQCISSGVHLLFHQYYEWNRCIVHEIGLTTLCEDCGRTLCKYEYPMFDKVPFICQSCQYKLWDGDRKPTDAEISLRAERLEGKRSIHDSIDLMSEMKVL